MKVSKDRKKALVIAVSDYEECPNLKHCKNDGNAVYELLKSLAYQVNDKDGLVGHVKSDQMKDAIVDFFTNEAIRTGDTLLLYYSGHGIQSYSDGNVYLAPVRN